MFKVMVCLLVGIPAISYAQGYGCATVGASMESSLFDAIKNRPEYRCRYYYKG